MELQVKCVVNPKTNRIVKVGSAAWKRLVAEDVLPDVEHPGSLGKVGDVDVDKLNEELRCKGMYATRGRGVHRSHYFAKPIKRRRKSRANADVDIPDTASTTPATTPVTPATDTSAAAAMQETKKTFSIGGSQCPDLIVDELDDNGSQLSVLPLLRQ